MWIDTDGGSDDFVAIAMAIASPSIWVDGISCVDGNVDLKQCWSNVQLVLRGFEHKVVSHIKCVAGATEPIVRKCYRAYETHGEDGLSGYDKDCVYGNSCYPNLASTVDKIVVSVATDRDTIIMCLGPLTNIAYACKLHPDIMRRANIWAMATAGRSEGNVTPIAEFNVWQDAEAVKIVLDTCEEVHFIGWDICLDAMFTAEDIKQIYNSGIAGKTFMAINETLIKLNEDRFGSTCLDFADPIAMAIALNPEFCGASFEQYGCHVCISDNEDCYGGVNLDVNGYFDYKQKAYWATKIDKDATKLYFRALIAALNNLWHPIFDIDK